MDLSDEFRVIDWELLIADGNFYRSKKGEITWGAAT